MHLVGSLFFLSPIGNHTIMPKLPLSSWSKHPDDDVHLITGPTNDLHVFPPLPPLPPPPPIFSMSAKYPKYYKPVGTLTEIDVYAIHHLFAIDDPSGAIQHASKKLLLSGVRTGGKTKVQDIREARDTLNRWLELNPEPGL